LGGLFVVHWTVPQPDLLEEFLHMWESTKDGQIQTIVCGERINVDQMLIVKQFGVSAKEQWMQQMHWSKKFKWPLRT